MASIDDLKIGATVGYDEEKSNVQNIAVSKAKTVIKPSYVANQQKEVLSAAEMISRAEPDPIDPNLREDPVKDLLVGDDSVFGKYLSEKKQEFEERMAEYDQEMELNNEEDDLDNVDETINNFLSDDDTETDSLHNDDMSVEIMKDEDMLSKYDEVKKDIVETRIDIENIDNDEDDIDIEVDSEKIDIPIESEDDIETVDEEDTLETLKRLATEKLKPNKPDISSFTILKKPSSNTMKYLQHTEKAAKWVLPSQNTVVFMKEFLGYELETLRTYSTSTDSRSLSSLTRRFKIIYDHIASPKPIFDKWLKTTPFSDIDHYYFAIFVSSFKDTNFLPMDCKNDKCKNIFLTDDTPIMNMVKFENDEAREKFIKIYKEEKTISDKGLYCSEIVPLNNNLAIGFKDPSIYSVFELSALDDKFKEKYASTLEYFPYIDAVYMIDSSNKQLVPVGYKVYPENPSKSVKSKIIAYHKALSTLTADEFQPIKSYIRFITEKTNEIGIRYIYPSIECPKCHTVSEEVETTAEELVFTRYQLGALVNTSLN